MRYYFRLSDMDARKTAILQGGVPQRINLCAETDEIVKDFEDNPTSDWWGVYKSGSFSTEFADFDSKEDAEKEYYATEAEDIYCFIHDC